MSTRALVAGLGAFTESWDVLEQPWDYSKLLVVSALEGQLQGSVAVLAPSVDLPPAQKNKKWQILRTTTAPKTRPGVLEAALRAEPSALSSVRCSP